MPRRLRRASLHAPHRERQRLGLAHRRIDVGPGLERQLRLHVSSTYVNIGQHVRNIERNEMLDVTPCTTRRARGVPDPTARTSRPIHKTRAEAGAPAASFPRRPIQSNRAVRTAAAAVPRVAVAHRAAAATRVEGARAVALREAVQVDRRPEPRARAAAVVRRAAEERAAPEARLAAHRDTVDLPAPRGVAAARVPGWAGEAATAARAAMAPRRAPEVETPELATHRHPRRPTQVGRVRRRAPTSTKVARAVSTVVARRRVYLKRFSSAASESRSPS